MFLIAKSRWRSRWASTKTAALPSSCTSLPTRSSPWWSSTPASVRYIRLKISSLYGKMLIRKQLNKFREFHTLFWALGGKIPKRLPLTRKGNFFGRSPWFLVVLFCSAPCHASLQLHLLHREKTTKREIRKAMWWLRVWEGKGCRQLRRQQRNAGIFQVIAHKWENTILNVVFAGVVLAIVELITVVLACAYVAQISRRRKREQMFTRFFITSYFLQITKHVDRKT